MTEPKRVQLSRRKGWRMPENTLKVDQSTQWGNDLTAEDYGSVEHAVDMFDHDLDKFECFHSADYTRWITPLIGKNLACWCALDAPACHADVLLRRAGEEAEFQANRPVCDAPLLSSSKPKERT